MGTRIVKNSGVNWFLNSTCAVHCIHSIVYVKKCGKTLDDAYWALSIYFHVNNIFHDSWQIDKMLEKSKSVFHLIKPKNELCYTFHCSDILFIYRSSCAKLKSFASSWTWGLVGSYGVFSMYLCMFVWFYFHSLLGIWPKTQMKMEKAVDSW